MNSVDTVQDIHFDVDAFIDTTTDASSSVAVHTFVDADIVASADGGKEVKAKAAADAKVSAPTPATMSA